MKAFRSNRFAASALFLCSGALARLEAGRILSDGTTPAPATYSSLQGSFVPGIGFTADRIEGSANLLAPLYRAGNGRTMLFLDGNWNGKGNGNENASGGLGFRHRFEDPNVILGLNAFYDHGDYSGRGYHQFGSGLELLSEWFDFRANGYFPSRGVERFDRRTEGGSFSDTRFSSTVRSSSGTRSSTAVIDGGEGFPDQTQTTTTTNSTVKTTTHVRQNSGRDRRTFERREAALPGFDLELGGLVPYLNRWSETRIYAGYAYFDEPFGNDISCFTARLETRPVPAVVFNVEYKGDARLLFGNDHWFFGTQVEIPFDLGNLLEGKSPFAGITAAFTPHSRIGANSARNRMNEQIVRNWRPVVSQTGFQEVSDEHERKQAEGTVTATSVQTSVSRSVTQIFDN